MSGGLLASLGALANTLVGMAHTRLELLSTDLEEDRARLITIVGLYIIAFFCLMVGLVLFTFFMVMAFWDTHRLLVLGFLSGGFVIASLVTFVYAKHKMKSKPKLFSASLLELLKDRQAFDPR